MPVTLNKDWPPHACDYCGIIKMCVSRRELHGLIEVACCGCRGWHDCHECVEHPSTEGEEVEAVHAES